MPAPVSGRVGVAAPGVELKLEPVGALLEARVRGPNVTPGYWRDPALTARRVRRRGLLRDGRRARLRRSGRSRARVHVPGAHRRGLQALDRHVGAGRAAARGAARGARRAGAGRRHRGARARRRAACWSFPNLAACRRLAGLPAEAPVGDVLDGEAVCASVRGRAVGLQRGAGRQLHARRRARCCWRSRRRSTPARSPTRGRSTRRRCCGAAPRSSTRSTAPARRCVLIEVEERTTTA